MKTYNTIEVTIKDQIAFLRLNRPEVRNALNAEMISEIREVTDQINKNIMAVRGLVMQGNGKVFSAGADINWMKAMVHNSSEENRKNGEKLYDLFDRFYHLSVPTITLVHGASIGGANGLLAASDMVLTESNTQFRFSEVKIGLVPATIAPFVTRRTGTHLAKYYMLTGKNFNAEDALRIGLADSAGSRESIETELDILIKELNKNSPEAVRETKILLNKIDQNVLNDTIKDLTIETITQARESKEGQEGMKAFLEKRQPYWKN